MSEPGRFPVLSRRRFVVGSGAALLATGALGAEALVFGPRRLDVSEHVLGDPTSGGPRVRLAVLADLHISGVSDLHRRVADSLASAKPDVIALVGDSIDDADNLPVLGEFLALLPGDAARLATLGNWEHWSGVDVADLRRTYERADTRLLVNEGLEIADGAVLFGTDDALAGAPSLSGIPSRPGVSTLLLSHSPAIRDTLGPSGQRIRAVVSGHTHGGQVAVGGWAPMTPPGSGRYVSGWYRGTGPDLFVSRGIGTSVLPVRLGCPPELAIIDWYPEGAS